MNTMTVTPEATMTATERAQHIAEALADPETVNLRHEATHESLGAGKLGVALLHLERARREQGDSARAHAWLRTSIHPAINSSAASNLFNGTPALAFSLHTTGAHALYKSQWTKLHQRAKEITAERLNLAQQRMKANRPGSFVEFGQLSGLTGLGTYLLHTEPTAKLTGEVLSYLVDLTRPLKLDGVTVPGWWANHDPYLGQSDAFPTGHANLGCAHGIGGVLALLAIAMRTGITVPGHRDAVELICAVYDAWQHENGWWPQWITLTDVKDGHISQPGPGRSSWCYGAPGIARSLQMAAIALRDPIRQRRAEDALLRCLADEDQRNTLTDSGLCHGLAGLYRIAQRAAEDAQDTQLVEALPGILHRLLTADSVESGFLDGDAGVALVLHEAGTPIDEGSTWDSALLLAAPRGPQ
ncbi:lanthionine synthetase C family protein [Natronoglycomyces albus]|uniref:Lanthionine synthetase C family protein n=1 Tax=Natronoglycomyces albus TaxID=2811108 RepID=A0A895XSH0_9ACTN|nr:lanthionine synthetase C family protein [Natronoglycomyces albus]QSB06453.1 lanthionine synthetase C family protein [Natronoglycomyces albus]